MALMVFDKYGMYYVETKEAGLEMLQAGKGTSAKLVDTTQRRVLATFDGKDVILGG